MKRISSFIAVAFAGALAFGEANAVSVDTELQLLIDVSGSVDATEFNLQQQGYVDAFLDPAVLTAIQAGDIGAIAVQAVYFGSTATVAVPWTLIDDEASAISFANAIGAAPRPGVGPFTGLSNAIDFAVPQFTDNGFEGSELVIDVSGDGAENVAAPFGSPAAAAAVSTSRTNALNSGVDQINGLPILGEAGLESFYADNVIGGPNSFLIAANGFEDFDTAILEKLTTEISTEVPLPLSAWLLLTGVAALGAASRMRKAA